MSPPGLGGRLIKTTLPLWPTTRVTSDNNGNLIVYYHDEAAIAKLGQAKSLRLEVVSVSRSSNLARLDVKVWEAARGGVRPSAGLSGAQVGATTTISTLGITNIDVAGPFHGRVEVTLGAYSSTPAAGTQESVEVVVTATMIYS